MNIKRIIPRLRKHGYPAGIIDIVDERDIATIPTAEVNNRFRTAKVQVHLLIRHVGADREGLLASAVVGKAPRIDRKRDIRSGCIGNSCVANAIVDTKRINHGSASKRHVSILELDDGVCCPSRERGVGVRDRFEAVCRIIRHEIGVCPSLKEVGWSHLDRSSNHPSRRSRGGYGALHKCIAAQGAGSGSLEG